jgi:hypothetical protein
VVGGVHVPHGVVDQPVVRLVSSHRQDHIPAAHTSPVTLTNISQSILKVPKYEIFDCLDFHDFYTIKHFWVSDFGAKV